jgi:hypothetical protein
MAPIDYGAVAAFELTFVVEDTFGLGGGTCSVNIEGVGVNFQLDGLGGAGGLQLGGFYTHSFEIVMALPPRKGRQIAFFSPVRYSVVLSMQTDRGGTLFRETIGSVEVGAILANRDDICLTGNADVENAKRQNRIERIDFPDGEPIHHARGNGDATSELTDGVFSGWHSPTWESVYWRGDWEPKRRRIEFSFDRESEISGVLVVSPSSYDNYWIHRMSVEISRDGTVYEPAGSAGPFLKRSKRGLQILILKDMDFVAKNLRLTFEQFGGATDIVVSEVYIFGK